MVWLRGPWGTKPKTKTLKEPLSAFLSGATHLAQPADTMPIKWVLHWQPNAGTTVNSTILAEVSQCVESINGVKEGKWKSTLSFYRPVLKEQANQNEFPRDFLGISLPEQPNKYYFVLRGQRLVLEADSTIQTIMEKLQSYKTRVALNFEGFQYQLGDFQLRVGKVVPIHSESLRGIIMEISGGRLRSSKWRVRAANHLGTLYHVTHIFRKMAFQYLEIGGGNDDSMEYRPISSWEKTHKIMGEFFDIWQEAMAKRSLPGHFVHMEPNFGEFGLSDRYSPQHTAVQYATIMLQMIATAQSVRN